jgi:lipopolysaccharide assembly outer membrane protein LptD (OstA)
MTFNYTQTDMSGNPEWTITGNWSLMKSPSVVLNFDAVINMVKQDGSEDYEHKVSNLTIPYAPINQTNSTVIQGTTSITMRDGLVTDEPTTITLKGKYILVYFDPSKIENHFGNQSIAGVVTRQTFTE